MKKAVWIRADELRHESTLYLFSKEITLPEGAKLTARVSADSRYKLFVNDVFAAEGPCHGTHEERLFETVDLTPFLTAGKNRIALHVLHVTDGVWISLIRQSMAAMWFDGTLTLPDGASDTLVSDDSWDCYRFENRRFYEFPGFIRSIPPVEEIAGEDAFARVKTAIFENATPESLCFNEYGVRETYPLTPRSIPVWQPGEAVPFTSLAVTDLAAEFDAGRYETAYIHLRIRSTAGATVRVISAECRARYDENGKAHKALRDDPAGEIRGPFDTLTFTRDGVLTFDSFYWRAFRFFRLEGTAPFTVEDFTYSPYYYPMGDEGKITASDPRYEREWEISRHTVMACAHDNYVDCPFYEQQQYDMDSGLQELFTYRMTADAALPRKSLSDLAHSQLSDGMLQANYPSVVVQVIPTFSLFWILSLREYLRYTGDLAFVRSMYGTMEKIVTGFENLLDENGLVGPTPYWPFVDWAPEWGVTGSPDGGTTEPLIANSLLYAYTLQTAAEIANAVGRNGAGSDYSVRAGKVIDAVNAHGYDAETKMYRNTPTRAQFSQHTALWAVLCGAVQGDEARELMRRVMTGDGISRCTFSMNYYLFRALETTGLYDEFAPELFRGWHKMLDEHCTTWCENPDDPRSECHGWSAAPIYELSASILGVMPTSDGFRTVRVAPRLGWFDHMAGTVPTPHGVLSVAWEQGRTGKTVTVRNPAPEKIRITFVSPDGTETVQTTPLATYFILNK